MKLRPDFIAQEIEDTTFLVPVGNSRFKGLVRSNRTAAFIVECLKEDTDPGRIADAMCAKYDAPRETIERDVAEILDILRSIDALEE